MRSVKTLVALILVITTIFLCGCDKKMYSHPILTRDNYNTGGNLTFLYDEQSHVAYFGGEGEVVQFYEEDIAKGWTEKGCRIGVMLNIPKELKDYKSAIAKVNGNELNANDFIVEISEERSIAQFQPIVSSDNKIINIKITWAENSQTQEYKIIIKAGTIFMSNLNK